MNTKITWGFLGRLVACGVCGAIAIHLMGDPPFWRWASAGLLFVVSYQILTWGD